MAVITNYNPELHDIYRFNGTPILDRLNPPGPNALVSATGYNPSNLLLNTDYEFPRIDWSGLHVRPRGFISYAWNDTSYTLGFFNPGYPQSASSCFYNGCPPGDFSVAENFNYWNNGAFAAILISPSHLLVCQHYAGTSNYEIAVTFIGNDNTIYAPKTAKKVAVFGQYVNEADAANGVIGLGPKLNDLYLYKLDTPLTEQEQQKIKVYPFADYETIPPMTPAFVQDPNGKMRIVRVVGYSFGTPIFAQYPTQDPNIPNISGVHKGDSGSPCLVYLNGETCFLANLDGGYVLLKENLEKLKEYVYQDIGYVIRVINGGFYQDTTPEIETVENTSPLSQYPYLSRYSTSIQSFNFDRICFKPRSNVQASELNEVQENFYNQQSKSIEMMHHWFGNKILKQQTDGITFSGPTNISPYLMQTYGKNIFDSKWTILTPLKPDQIKKSTNDNVSISAGWYFIKAVNSFTDETGTLPSNTKTTLYRWIYNPISYTVNLNDLEYFAVGTSSYTISGLNPYLKDNSYPKDAERRPVGMSRLGTEITEEIIKETIPTTAVTLSDPIVLYKQNGRYYLPNGFEVI